ncbi:nucleoside hydrolase [Oceanirhabdus sp. W0125-5]|uniref:nucleoside hydrolase n=1 Tax=Oceanirhabdus sp. W0125-5 TaxID=2999116 RepID=UPI0022F2D9B3|nr:nucleoside hydrolase [Oceanirhabdus sp. W0125-5]WBW94731.1 nucleoside hydrolase [Oceanirhabdus sp. W0125-5]
MSVNLRKKPVIIDCDPGYDDALALILALGNDKLNVRAITTCAGNQTGEKILKNALNIVNFLEKDITVALGAKKPLMRELEIAPEVHGETGLDGAELPESDREPNKENAIVLMKKIIMESNEKITIIVTGPLTNIALLLTLYPEIKDKICEISLMGGACFGGNVTPSAEYNIKTDPEAAEIVFKSGINITMCGLDVTHKALFTKDDFEDIRGIGNKTSELAYRILLSYSKYYEENTELEGIPVHDACAVAYAIDSSMFETKKCFVTVETKGEYTTGQTVVDYRDLLRKEKNTNVAFDIDKGTFLNLIKDSIRKLP